MAQPRYRRARREEEKADRRRAILAAADALLAEVGYEAFSMVRLAKLTGLAKGTLYLYFETREEVLLALYLELRERWGEAFEAGLTEHMSDEAFIEHYLKAALDNLPHLELRARITAINYNVSIERLVEARRVMREGFLAHAPLVEHALGLAKGGGVQVLTSFRALLIGASQLYEDPGVEELPRDVKIFAKQYSRSNVFRAYAPLLLAGIRAETTE